MTKGKKPVPAYEVTSPKRRLTLVAVLDDGMKKKGDGAVALVRWDGKPRLGIRWNGDAKGPVGTPQSRGLPTWFLMPERFNDAILSCLNLSTANKALVAHFFEDGATK